MRPRVPNAPRNWPLRRLAGKAPSCRPTGSIVCRFEVRDFAPGRAGADPAPRGAGPEAGDGSAAQTCSSAHPAEAGIGFGGVLCFQKAKYWDQLPSLSSESKREDATARFLCRGFPYESSRGIPCSAYTGTYPIPGFKAPALRLPTPSGRNLKNSAQNLVRMEPGKIATHYKIALCIRGCGEEISPRCSHCMMGCERNTTWHMGPSGPQIEGDYLGGIAAESLLGITDQRVEVHVFDGLTVSLVLPVHATATGGLSHVDPVGRSIASSAKTMGV